MIKISGRSLESTFSCLWNSFMFPARCPGATFRAFLCFGFVAGDFPEMSTVSTWVLYRGPSPASTRTSSITSQCHSWSICKFGVKCKYYLEMIYLIQQYQTLYDLDKIVTYSTNQSRNRVVTTVRQQ